LEKSKLKQIISKIKKLTVLYVEDDKKSAEKTLNILKKIFDHIVYAKDGEDGLQKYSENHIDLIITDIRMPKLDGISMLEKIFNIQPDVSVIIITAHNERDYYKDALNLNVDGYLLKPLIMDELIHLLGNIVDKIDYSSIQNRKLDYLLDANKRLIDMGYQISNLKNYDLVLESILLSAKELTNADGGTLYIFNKEKNTLEFKIAINTSLNVHIGGSNNTTYWDALNFYNNDGSLNKKNISIVSALEEKLINISDIYKSDAYDFSGAKEFDIEKNYKTASMLVMPMKNRENDLIGVIQLINKQFNKQTIPFYKDDESIIKAISSQATMVIENNQLVEELEKLLYALVASVGKALDEKSKYTAKHINHVAVLTQIIAKGINKNTTIFKDVEFLDNELEEIKLSAWLHDIGKISTPEHLIDKATKLETVYDRIDTIKSHFEILKRDIEIAYLKNDIDEKERDKKIANIEDDLSFLEEINHGDVYMSDEYLNRLEKISRNYGTIIINNKIIDILSDDHIYNLSTKKGTLTKENRKVINDHVVVTYDMLKDIPMPKKLSNVAKIAASHHKDVDGIGGYAHKELIGKEMSIQDKILAVADVFEALSAKDRPYKDAYKLSKIVDILISMVQNGQLDKNIVRVFFEDELYKEYAQKYIDESQIDNFKIDYGELEYKY
jgi:response regulator RpfG family c-di-GMP phosphodiesterase